MKGCEAGARRLEKICAALPESVVTRHGQHSGFEVRTKKYAWHTVDEHGDGRVALICKAERGENAILVASDPSRFFMPKYMAHHGWIGVFLDVPNVDWDEVRELITDAYVLAAPKILATQVTTAAP
jgi:hypothetical protein